MQTYAIISNPIPPSFYSTTKPMAPRLVTSTSTQHLPTHDGLAPGRLPASASAVSLTYPQSASMHSLGVPPSRLQSSGTWTTSSAEMGLLGDVDDVGDRDLFVFEYNRLAKKHGVRLIMVDDFSAEQQGLQGPEKRGWLQRLLRTRAQPRHKRSVSDLAHMLHTGRDGPKLVDIQDMVRLSGKSMLYLPHEYTPCSLILPTCIRATAQHLSQNVTTRGLFRIPGSVRVVTALFDHYCQAERSGGDVAATVRGASLPLHIAHSVHDVASTFKRLLSVLPGGILGSLALLDALVAIYSQLNGEPEFPRTKQTKVRARLIALAIGTVKSHFRRELICAVFGLLSLIGRAAEVAPREDDEGRPLPTSDLMGYGALGIVFGPLLVGNMLEQYTMKLVTPTTGMLLFPLSPPRLRRERRKTKPGAPDGSAAPAVDKVMVANGITEMLIANWRDVVRQMRSLGMHYRRDISSVNLRNSLRPSTDQLGAAMPSDSNAPAPKDDLDLDAEPDVPPRKGRRRSKPLRNSASQRLMPKMSLATLSPTREESTAESDSDKPKPEADPGVQQDQPPHSSIVRILSPHDEAEQGARPLATPDRQVSPESIPPRVSSRSREDRDDLGAATAGLLPVESPKLPSPVSDKGGPTIPNRASSFDGSEDPPSRAPSCAASHGEAELGGKRAGIERRPSHLSRALLPLDRNSLDVKDARPESRQRQATRGTGGLDKENLNSDTSNLGRTPASQLAESRAGEAVTASRAYTVDRASLDKTPEGFYSKSSERDLGHGRSQGITVGSPFHGAARSPRELSSNTMPDDRLFCRAHSRSGRSRSHAATDENQQRSERDREVEAQHGSRQLRSHGSHGQVKAAIQTPSRSSSSEALSKRGSVRAMAAKFESQEPGAKARAGASGDCNCATTTSVVCACRRQSAWRRSSSDKSLASSIEAGCSRNSSRRYRRMIQVDASGRRPQVDAASQTDNLLQTEVPQAVAAVSSMPTLKWNTDPLAHRVQSVPSLGTMLPHRELPPVAHHVHRPRPLSAHQDCQDDVPVESFSRASSGTTLLYAQIQRLQRHLGTKTEEASQLRRQLDAQEGAEAGTLSEQLRGAMRDANMWRERAVTAERRVKVFERFTERLRGIRDAIFRQPDSPEQNEYLKKQGRGPRGAAQEDEEDGFEARKKSNRGEVAASEDSGEAQDAGIVAARIRKCLHRRSGADGKLERPESPTSLTVGGDGTWSPDSNVSDGTELMWEVAQELLQLEDDGVL
ncbi:hypothetical protein CDD82_5246 [Ophiocordyceps australis]|uniref:Rho-GAP domain-containing protein n=1 Tax=Ophiocordyceps australis TaxID=1399860 RepID=A0A2C5Z3U2_9HYPO|nr:hypothetical protein CDD82_5246 [Ophiocordyceps australis]